LRGNVYTRYRGGRWLPAGREAPRELRARSLPDPLPESVSGASAQVALIRYAKSDLDRFFLPSEPRAIEFSPASVRIDRMGIARAVAGEHPVAMRLSPGSEPAFAPAPPDAGDLALPDELALPLRELAADWTAPGDSPRARLDALRRRLEAGYAYSLDFALPDEATGEGAKDPLLAFLHDRKSGHCEYFATAITLLARTSDLPARMVTGYRVAERNRFGGYAIVRERHAHAWSEVFLEGEGWVTVDPSPLRGHAGLAQSRTPMLVGLFDWAWVAWQRRGPEALLVVLVVGLVTVQVRRLVVGRRPAGGRQERPVSDPPPHMEALLQHLTRVGQPRRAGESLEALARRLDNGPAWRTASELLRRYAALRYGGVGSGETIRVDVETWLRENASA